MSEKTKTAKIQTMEEFLGLNKEKAVEFDFLRETMPANKRVDNDNIQTYINYKKHRPKKNGKSYDPDASSNILQEIYGLLWKDIANKHFMRQNDRTLSDTMTSVQSFINQAMKIYDKTDKENENFKMWYEQINGKWGEGQRYSFNVLKTVYGKSEDTMEKVKKVFEEEFPLLYDLIRYYHTIGNYCPVPFNFNQARSGYYASHDMWDLTLMKIREYYLCCGTPEVEYRIISEELLHNNGNALACKFWLDEFGNGIVGWKNFIKLNYFDDYVDKDYEVKSFWVWEEQKKKHDWNNISIPDDKETFNKGVTEIVDRIKQRGSRIVEAINEINEKKEKCDVQK